jgi:hypothetical protein
MGGSCEGFVDGLHPNNLSDSETVDCDGHHNHARWTAAQKSESACGNAGNVLEIFPAIAAARTDRLDSFRMRY